MVLLQPFSQPTGQLTGDRTPKSTAAHPSLLELEIKAVTPLANNTLPLPLL